MATNAGSWHFKWKCIYSVFFLASYLQHRHEKGHNLVILSLSKKSQTTALTANNITYCIKAIYWPSRHCDPDENKITITTLNVLGYFFSFLSNESNFSMWHCLQKPTNGVLSWCYRGRLSSPLQSGAFPLKHLYAFNLHYSLIMYADLSWYLVAADQALILQCNSMLQARRVWASKYMWKDWLCTAAMFPGALYESKLLLSYTSHTDNCILVSFNREHWQWEKKTFTYLPESSFFMHDLKEMNFSSTRTPCGACETETEKDTRYYENKMRPISWYPTRWQYNFTKITHHRTQIVSVIKKCQECNLDMMLWMYLIIQLDKEK